MTWLQLYNFLHQKANDIYNPDPNFWNQQAMIHNMETGDEYTCDTWFISDRNKQERCVLMINLEELRKQ